MKFGKILKCFSRISKLKQIRKLAGVYNYVTKKIVMYLVLVFIPNNKCIVLRIHFHNTGIRQYWIMIANRLVIRNGQMRQ